MYGSPLLNKFLQIVSKSLGTLYMKNGKDETMRCIGQTLYYPKVEELYRLVM